MSTAPFGEPGHVEVLGIHDDVTMVGDPDRIVHGIGTTPSAVHVLESGLTESGLECNKPKFQGLAVNFDGATLPGWLHQPYEITDPLRREEVMSAEQEAESLE